ncbi:MAG: aspartate 1-decarboxylase [Deltaproteobacteria bacterium]
MFRIMLKSKIHRAHVTAANLYYEGSITIDAALMDKADILPGEKVEIFNLSTGGRIETYAIKGRSGSGVICLNGPSARAAHVGDQIIIVSYAIVEEDRIGRVKPKMVYVNERNRVKN